MIDSVPADPLAVTLETDRLLLRPIRREDTPFAVRHFTDPEVYRFMRDDEPITTAEQATAIVAFYVDQPGDTYNRWVLVRKTDGVALGTCGYHRWNRQHRKAEIGYDLSPTWQGQGYMREAVAAMLAHGFTAMHLHRIEAVVAVANARSAHLLRQLGFAHEGVLRESFFSGGQFHDHLLFARLSHAEA
ncbi:MAG: GNAT family N-acetyltransferase [Chloroflexales bacterium]|nr:GNAT family N-acetyltransferase [Chloroflexales bacterium]